LLLIPLLVGCPTAGSPEPSDDDDSAPVLDLQDLLDDAVADSAGFGGGVLRVSRGDELLWEGASGDAVRDPTTPMEVTDTFEIASVSKTFTAALTLLLADEGLFGLDDPLGDHLPSSLLDDLLVVDGLDRSGTITIRQCLNHTSGLPDYWNDPPFEAWGWCNAFCVAYIDDVNRFWEPEEILAFGSSPGTATTTPTPATSCWGCWPRRSPARSSTPCTGAASWSPSARRRPGSSTARTGCRTPTAGKPTGT